MRLLKLVAHFLLFTTLSTSAKEPKEIKPPEPCTIYSPTSGSFFDLRPLSVQPLIDGKKAHKDDRIESWHARGYDYPANFTLNFCAPVIEELEDVVGLGKDVWKNVSAYYKIDGRIFSIGQQSSSPVFRGRKLVMNYTSGSPCSSRRASRKLHDEDDDEDDRKPSQRRKSTLISLLCDRDPLATSSVAFVGASPDECTYFFEARSMAACGKVSEARQTLGPGGVFGVIAIIAVVVYVLGGCAYQRIVMQQRGLKQLPNYSIWAGIGSFFKDVFIITASTCGRIVPRRKGYNQLSAHGRERGSEDENRLIDQLDEEWDD